jgi:hypothetical protein
LPSFTHIVDRLETLGANHEQGDLRDVAVRDIMAAIGRRSYGPLLLLIGLFSISPATIVPGMTWLAASLALILSLQMAVGARYPWLPRALLDAKMTRASVRAASEALRPWAQRIDGVLRPRLTALADVPFVNIAGAFCATAALATYPLGLVPMAPVAPGVAIALVGLGLMIRDGLLLLFGAAVVGAAIWLAYAVVT